MRPVLQHRREIFVACFDKIFADNDQRDSAGAQILLSTGVDQAVPANIDRTTEDIAAGIADQKRGVRDAGWFRSELRAEDRIVGREVNVGRVFAVRAGFRNVVEVGVLARAGDVRARRRTSLPSELSPPIRL